jgi:hypothetical protein
MLLTGVYVGYAVTRLLVDGSHDRAVANAQALLGAESSFGVAHERWFNRYVSARQVLAVPADNAYASCHYLVTLVVLVWLWRCQPAAYLRGRRTLVVATLLALIAYWALPVAPPRMLPGFVDTMATYRRYGWWGGEASAPSGLGAMTNQLAAMPTLHVGWAVWCGAEVVRHARRRRARLAGVLYPLFTVLVVVGTGNHYLADAVAGAGVLLLGHLLVRIARPIAPPSGRLVPRLSLDPGPLRER